MSDLAIQLKSAAANDDAVPLFTVGTYKSVLNAVFRLQERFQGDCNHHAEALEDAQGEHAEHRCNRSAAAAVYQSYGTAVLDALASGRPRTALPRIRNTNILTNDEHFDSAKNRLASAIEDVLPGFGVKFRSSKTLVARFNPLPASVNPLPVMTEEQEAALEERLSVLAVILTQDQDGHFVFNHGAIQLLNGIAACNGDKHAVTSDDVADDLVSKLRAIKAEADKPLGMPEAFDLTGQVA